MTSRSSSSNPATANRLFDTHLFFGKVRRGNWLTGLIAAALFFVLPVVTALRTGDSGMQYVLEQLQQALTTPEAIRQSLEHFVTVIMGVAMVQGVAFALLCALTAWGWLNSKQQGDFYHSMPFSRQSLFATSYAYGVMAFLLPLLVMSALSVLVMVFNGFGAFVPWATVWDMLLRTVVLFLSVFSIATLACMLCGTVLTAFLGSFVFLGGPAALIGMVAATFRLYYDTFFFQEEFWTRLLRLSSPVGDILSSLGNNGTYSLWWWLFVIVALTALSLLACTLRPAEGAGKAIVSRRVKPFIHLGLVFLSTLGMGYLFRELGESDGWLLFGFLAGGLFMSALVQSIFAFDLRSAFKGVRQLTLFLAVFAVGFSVFYFDLTGYDSRLPDRDRVTAADILVGDGRSILNRSGGMDPDDFYRDSKEIQYMTFDDPAILDIAVDLAAQGVEIQRLMDANEYGWMQDGGDAWVSLAFTQGGSTYIRTYTLPIAAVEQAVAQLYDQPAYRSRLYFMEAAQEGQYLSLAITDPLRETSNSTRVTSVQLITELIEALSRDIQRTDSAALSQATQLALLRFSEQSTPDYTSRYPVRDREVVLYDCYTDTLAVLARYSIALPAPLSAEELDRVSLSWNPEQLAEDYPEIRALYDRGLLRMPTDGEAELEGDTFVWSEEGGMAIPEEVYLAERYGIESTTDDPLMGGPYGDTWWELVLTDPEAVDWMLPWLHPALNDDANPFDEMQEGVEILLWARENLPYGMQNVSFRRGEIPPWLIGEMVRQVEARAADLVP